MPMWCEPCPQCPGKHRAIGGDGPRPAKVLIVLERPGQDENRNGRVACGKTGQELDELYLPLAGLDRSEVRVCNTVLCWADNNKTPTDKEIAQCAGHHLIEEIEKTDPKVIILGGSTACGLVPGIKLELHHGVPQPTSKVGTLLGWSGWLIPMFHPAIGLHESRWMTICMEDWGGMRHLIGDQWRFQPDPEPKRVSYSIWTNRHTWLSGEWPIGIDTESHGGQPWSVQVSGLPRSGVLYRTSDRGAMDHLRRMMACQSEIVMHNAAYDLEVLRKLDIPVRSYRDTMQEAYHLGNLPQGLKALAYRLFRHTMTSYEETVRPASLSALYGWMTEAYLIAQADLSFVQRVRLNTKVKEVVNKGTLETLLIRLLRLTDAESEYDPWERLDEFWAEPTNDWMASHIEDRIGHYPILGIGNCAMDDAVRYAVGDADWTGRVATELARRRQNAFKIYEGDRDV